MRRADLELLIREAGRVGRQPEFFLLGSQAIRGSCDPVPKDVPLSFEADLYPMVNEHAVRPMQHALGRDSEFATKHKIYVDCCDPAMATLPVGWMERLVPFKTPNTGGVTAWCLELHDLFCAKLVANRPKDITYLLALLKHRLVKPATLKARIGDLVLRSNEQEVLRNRLRELVKQTPKLKSAKRTQRAKP